MRLGFTGTREGMTISQKTMLASFMGMWMMNQEIESVHHGTCVGADDEFHKLCMWFGLRDRIILHLPEDSSLSVTQHLLDVPEENIMSPLPYLKRNLKIIDACDFLLAAPPTNEPQKRGGTWFTIRKAQEAGRELRMLPR